MMRPLELSHLPARESEASRLQFTSQPEVEPPRGFNEGQRFIFLLLEQPSFLPNTHRTI